MSIIKKTNGVIQQVIGNATKEQLIFTIGNMSYGEVMTKKDFKNGIGETYEFNSYI